MRTIANLLRAVNRIDIEDVLIQSMGDTSKEYVSTVKEQLLEGIAGDGLKIGYYRSEEYANMKFALNSRAGHGNVDLRLHGPYQDSFRADIDNEGLRIYSTDEKAKDLENKYGKGYKLGVSRLYLIAVDRRGPYISVLNSATINRLERLLNAAL